MYMYMCTLTLMLTFEFRMNPNIFYLVNVIITLQILPYHKINSLKSLSLGNFVMANQRVKSTTKRLILKSKT